MAELHFGIFLGGLDHEGLMAEAVCKNHLATGLDQFHSCIVAGNGFGDVRLFDDLFILQIERLLHGIHSVDKVLVVCGILIMQENEAHLEIVFHREVHLEFGSCQRGCALALLVAALRASNHGSADGKYHQASQNHRKYLLNH